MSLAKLIAGKSAPDKFATATPATVATQEGERGRTVATVATVAVATIRKPMPTALRLADLIAGKLRPEAANLPDLESFGESRRDSEVQADSDLPDDPAMERRRERVLAVLREHPERHRHVIFDPDAEPGVVIATVAVRMAQGGIATGELRIPADRYDPFLILAMLQRAEQ